MTREGIGRRAREAGDEYPPVFPSGARGVGFVDGGERVRDRTPVLRHGGDKGPPRPARRARADLPVVGGSVHAVTVPPPTAGGARPRGERRDAAENREQILVAARSLFAARGVDAVTMDEIARAAGVGKGTLYRRYAHKGLLCAALLDESSRRFQGEVLARAGRGGGDAPALADLEFFLTRLIAFNEENAELLSAVQDAAYGERRSGVYVSAAYDWQRLTVVALLRRAVAGGESPPDLDIEALADTVLAPFDIDLYLFQRRGRGFDADRISGAVRRLLLDGLRAREGPGR